MISTLNTNQQLRQKRKLEQSKSYLSDSSLDSTEYSISSCNCSGCYCTTLNNNQNSMLESPRRKMRTYETEMISYGYYNDPMKPNLYILSPGPGILELPHQQVDLYQSKRNYSRVNPISPYHSPYVLLTDIPSQIIIDPHNYQNYNQHNQHNQHNHQQQQQYQQDNQETDEEILSTLASIVSFDEEDYLEAVFLHFDEE